MEDKELFKKAVQSVIDYEWDSWNEYLDGYGWETMYEIALKFNELKLEVKK